MSTSRYFRGQRGAELRARWKKEGFVAKGNRELVRVVPLGLHIIQFSEAGSWDTSTSATFGVWLAPFEARTLGEPVPWQAKPFLVPEPRRWHAKIDLAELTGDKSLARIGGAGYPGEYAAAMVWNHWYVIDRWLQRHTDLPTLAELSIEPSREPGLGDWRRFQIAALCFLELGQPERAAEMMQGEWLYFHRPEVTRDTAAELLLRWWDRSAAWWRDVAGLRAPAYDGTPGPEVPAVRAPPPPKSTPRDSIWYASQLGGEWLKTRDLRQAVGRVDQLLALTTFKAWDQAELEIHADPTPALGKLTEFVELGRSAPSMPDRRELTFDRAALAAHSVEPDPILRDAIDTFGPPRFHCWLGSAHNDWSRCGYRFWWRRDHLDLPADWFAFCVAHQAAVLHDRPRARVRLTLTVRDLFLLDPRTRMPLPFQGDAFCPPHENTPSWPAHTAVTLHLPDCKMDLQTRLPFTEPGKEFLRYYDAMAKALGYRPSATHLRSLRINNAGTRAYDRRLHLG